MTLIAMENKIPVEQKLRLITRFTGDLQELNVPNLKKLQYANLKSLKYFQQLKKDMPPAIENLNKLINSTEKLPDGIEVDIIWLQKLLNILARVNPVLTLATITSTISRYRVYYSHIQIISICCQEKDELNNKTTLTDADEKIRLEKLKKLEQTITLLNLEWICQIDILLDDKKLQNPTDQDILNVIYATPIDQLFIQINTLNSDGEYQSPPTIVDILSRELKSCYPLNIYIQHKFVIIVSALLNIPFNTLYKTLKEMKLKNYTREQSIFVLFATIIYEQQHNQSFASSFGDGKSLPTKTIMDVKLENLFRAILGQDINGRLNHLLLDKILNLNDTICEMCSSDCGVELIELIELIYTRYNNVSYELESNSDNSSKTPSNLQNLKNHIRNMRKDCEIICNSRAKENNNIDLLMQDDLLNMSILELVLRNLQSTPRLPTETLEQLSYLLNNMTLTTCEPKDSYVEIYFEYLKNDNNLSTLAQSNQLTSPTDKNISKETFKEEEKFIVKCGVLEFIHQATIKCGYQKKETNK